MHLNIYTNWCKFVKDIVGQQTIQYFYRIRVLKKLPIEPVIRKTNKEMRQNVKNKGYRNF